MKLKEITPKRFSCTAWFCPAVFEVEGEDKLVIIGSKANLKKLGLSKRAGKDEAVIIVNREMLRQIFEK